MEDKGSDGKAGGRVKAKAKWLTAREVAEILQCQVETVRVWARRGILPGRKMPGGWRFRPADLLGVREKASGQWQK